MMRCVLLLIVVGSLRTLWGQGLDTINNLVHPVDYQTCRLGDLGEVKKLGSGPQNVILVPGLGFDGSIFSDFAEANRARFTMYVVTLAGFGGTAAPPMPPDGTSYGELTWMRGAVEGLTGLIEKERIDRAVIVGHFVVGSQIAVRLALDHPDKVAGVILVGGPAKFMAAMRGRIRDFPLDTMVLFTDSYMAPKWFKRMPKSFFDENNFLPSIYSLQDSVGRKLWEMPVEVPLPVMVRYSSEYFACDVRVELPRLLRPLLVLRPAFHDSVLSNPNNGYVKPQFIDSWDRLSEVNHLISVCDIPQSATFLWKDNPDAVYPEIIRFLQTLNDHR